MRRGTVTVNAIMTMRRDTVTAIIPMGEPFAVSPMLPVMGV